MPPNSTESDRRRKSGSAKPNPNFPFPPAPPALGEENPQQLHYFGSWDDPQAAIDRYLDQKTIFMLG